MQQGIHVVVTEQKRDLKKVRVDVGEFLRNSIAGARDVPGPNRPSSGPGPRDSRLNDPKKNEVDVLTDDISKA